MRKFRDGFSMLVAIFVIMMLSLVASYIFFASNSTTKTGTIQYQAEQAKLYARSFTEYAILAATGNDRNNTNQCISTINSTIGNDPALGQGYQIRVDLTYIGNGTNYNLTNCANVAANNVSTDSLSIIVDVYVQYKDYQQVSAAKPADQPNVPWTTYHRRSIQKLWENITHLQW